MSLASSNFGSNIGLRKPVCLDFFNEFRPVHVAKYRISGSISQRLCDRNLTNNSEMSKFAERVRNTRKLAKLSQKQLAKLAGLSQTTISDIERGRNEGSRDLLALAKALKVSAEWLINGKQSGDADAVVMEFTQVYTQSDATWRTFLKTAIHAAKRALNEAEAIKETKTDVVEKQRYK